MSTASLSKTSSRSQYVVHGGSPLSGEISIQGAKNAVLPMIAAALLSARGNTVLQHVPLLRDVDVAVKLAESVGAVVSYDNTHHTLVIDASSLRHHILDPLLTTQFRASVLFLPALLHRLGRVEMNGVGGDKLGARKLNFHYNGFKRLGAQIIGDHDHVFIEADQLRGNFVYLDTPSQTGTENLMMAACLAKGTTIIENASSEPEVVDFGKFLSAMGARLSGVGTRTIIIEGVPALHAIEYAVMPDRLDAGAFMMAAAITRGDITCVGADIATMRIFAVKLAQMGVTVVSEEGRMRVFASKRLRPVNVITWPHPGFHTDLFAEMMAVASLADGVSYFRENIFENRFTHVDGLRAFGANIVMQSSNVARVNGVSSLHGGNVAAPDVRAGMAFVLAGLASSGETVIRDIYHIERGFENVVERLQSLGGNIITQG